MDRADGGLILPALAGHFALLSGATCGYRPDKSCAFYATGFEIDCS